MGAWPNVLPVELTAARAVELTAAALADARARINGVADLFHGTVPPPPWPMNPALAEARRRMTVARDGLQAIANRAPNAPISAKAAATLRRLGADLERELRGLEKRAAESPRAEDLLSMFGYGVGGLAVLALIWYLVENRDA
jgi:uncharacterized membrane protein YccC